MIIIDGERLKKTIASREIDRLNEIPDDDKETYIRAYSDGVYDALELLAEHIDVQSKEGTNGII
jgi:hypothetical protein